MTPAKGTCAAPPEGWWCSLNNGHGGPCPTRQDHHPQCFQARGVPDDLPPDLCDCKVLRAIGMPDAGVAR